MGILDVRPGGAGAAIAASGRRPTEKRARGSFALGAGFDGTRAGKSTIRAAISRIPNGEGMIVWSDGTFSLHDLLIECGHAVGGDAELWTATWSLGPGPVSALNAKLESGVFGSAHVVVDRAWADMADKDQRKRPSIHPLMSVSTNSCHAKVAAIFGADGAFAIVTSQNLNENRRAEAAQVSRSFRAAEFLRGIIDDLAETGEPLVWSEVDEELEVARGERMLRRKARERRKHSALERKAAKAREA